MWIYESLDNTFWVWGIQQGCDLKSWRVTATPYDNEANNGNLQCFEFVKGCKTGRAMKCMHDGGHCAYPKLMADMMWWFWGSKSNNMSLPSDKPDIIQ